MKKITITTELAPTAAVLDRILSAAGENTHIHFGPGLFRTNGLYAWTVKSGQVISGEGMGVTVLQVVSDAPPAEVHTWAIGAGATTFLEGFECRDLSIDCNLEEVGIEYDVAGPVLQYPIAVGGIHVNGRDILIERVEVIGFGTYSLKHECFVIVAGVAGAGLPETRNCRIENCRITRPARYSVRETTCLNIGSRGEALHQACAVRNNFIDGDLIDGSSHLQEVRAEVVPNGLRLFLNDTAVYKSRQFITLQGFGAHHILAVEKEFVLVADVTWQASPLGLVDAMFVGANVQGMSADGGSGAVVERNHVSNLRIGGPYHDTFRTESLFVRRNNYRNVTTGPYQNVTRADWGAKLLVIEDNVIELARRSHSSGWGSPVGILISGVPGSFGTVVLRNNTVLRGASDGSALAIALHGAAFGVIRGNLTDVPNPKPIQTANCGKVVMEDNCGLDGVEIADFRDPAP